jgi:hypothetical protein
VLRAVTTRAVPDVDADLSVAGRPEPEVNAPWVDLGPDR